MRSGKTLPNFSWAEDLGGFHAAGYDPSLLKHSPDESGLSARHRSVREEFKRLLGPLVPALLRDAEGALDASRLKVKSREELFSFLQTQAELNDHSSFSDPYQRLLEDEEFSELLSLLYQEVDPDYSVYVSASEASELLQKFQARLIEIDADHFAQSHLNSAGGRKRIQNIFSKPAHYSLDQRADLAKAVARVSPDWEPFITQKVSLWNYWNLGVDEEDVDHASRVATSALEAKSRSEKDFSGRHQLYLNHPEQVTGVVHLESSTGLKIKPGEIKEMEELRLQGLKSLDPILQVKGKLAGLWLLAADADYFNEPLGKQPYGLNAWMIERVERFLAKADKIESEEELQKFNEKLQDFLKDGIAEPKESQSYTWVKHQFSGQGFKERFESRSPELKAPYEELLTLSDRWKYAQESGEAIFTKKTELKIKDPKLKEAVISLLQGLEQTKQELWYGYKQHKALSRGISNLANLAKAGDIQDIEGANREIDSLIKKLKNAETAEEVQTQVDKLQELLKEGNALHQGLKAAEMSGGEQLLGLIQTLGTILIAAAATRGLSLAAQGSAAVARGPAALGAIRNFVTGMTALRPVQGFLWGAAMATMENALAVSTGEVRVEKDTIEKWLKDALSTGASMALVTPLAKAGGQSVEQYLLKDLAARYLSHGSKGALNLLADTGLEAVEEVLDQYVRQALDGNYQALSLHEIQEIAKICLAGGGLQVGAVAMQNKRTGAVIAPSESSFAIPTTLKTRLQWMKNPLLAPMWAALSAGGLGGWDRSAADSDARTTLRGLEQDLIALRDEGAAQDSEIITHYSVIGDYLQSVGDPRGEWIALEIKRQELLKGGSSYKQVASIEEQIHRIRSEIAAKIEEDFRLSIRIDFNLEKGFSLVLEGDKSTGATQENWDRFFLSPHASLLEGIELEYFPKAQAWPLAEERLRHLGGLRRLRIHGSELDENLAPLARSSALSRLESLVLTCCGLDEAKAHIIAESKVLTNVQSLDLSHNFSFGIAGAQAIAKSDTLTNLQSLNLNGNFIGEAGAQAIAESKTLGNLQTLHLGLNDTGDEGVRAIAESSALANLTFLALEQNHFGEAGAQAIAQSKTLTNLQSLHLGLNYLGEEGAEAIARSAALTNLRSLKLGSCSIGAEGARAIAESKVLTNLQSLDIGDNSIGYAGVRAIAGSGSLVNLQNLDLGFNGIDDAGARVIAESYFLVNLRHLDLTFNPIDEATIQLIRESKNLPNLIELNGEEITRPKASENSSMALALPVLLGAGNLSSANESFIEYAPRLLGYGAIGMLTGAVACLATHLWFRWKHKVRNIDETVERILGPFLDRILRDTRGSNIDKTEKALGSPNSNLVTSLREGSLEKRVSAVYQLVDNKAHAFLPEILPLLNDPHPNFRNMVMNSVTYLSRLEAEAHLDEISPHADEEILGAAMLASHAWNKVLDRGVIIGSTYSENDTEYVQLFNQAMKISGSLRAQLAAKALDLSALANLDEKLLIRTLFALPKRLPSIPPTDRLEVVRQLEALLSNPNYLVRSAALRTLTEAVPLLQPEDRLPRILKMLELIKNLEEEGPESISLFMTAEFAIYGLIPALDPQARLALARALEDHLKDKGGKNRYVSALLLARIVPYLEAEERLPSFLILKECLRDAHPRVAGTAERWLGIALSELSEEERRSIESHGIKNPWFGGSGAAGLFLATGAGLATLFGSTEAYAAAEATLESAGTSGLSALALAMGTLALGSAWHWGRKKIEPAPGPFLGQLNSRQLGGAYRQMGSFQVKSEHSPGIPKRVLLESDLMLGTTRIPQGSLLFFESSGRIVFIMAGHQGITLETELGGPISLGEGDRICLDKNGYLESLVLDKARPIDRWTLAPDFPITFRPDGRLLRFRLAAPAIDATGQNLKAGNTVTLTDEGLRPPWQESLERDLRLLYSSAKDPRGIAFSLLLAPWLTLSWDSSPVVWNTSTYYLTHFIAIFCTSNLTLAGLDVLVRKASRRKAASFAKATESAASSKAQQVITVEFTRTDDFESEAEKIRIASPEAAQPSVSDQEAAAEEEALSEEEQAKSRGAAKAP